MKSYKVLGILAIFAAGLALGYGMGLRRTHSLLWPAWTLTAGPWSRGRPAQTISTLLAEYPELQLEARGTVQMSSQTMNLSVHLRSPDAAAPNAFEARARVDGPWENPTLHLESLKKKKFKARIGI